MLPDQGRVCKLPTKAEPASPLPRQSPQAPPTQVEPCELFDWGCMFPNQGRVCKPPTEARLVGLRPKKSFRAIFARKPQLLDILPESHPQKTSSPRNANRKSPGHEVFTVRHCCSREIRPANKPTFFANSAKNFARLDEKASLPQREEPLPPQRKNLARSS